MKYEFRGKRIKDETWVYGSLCEFEDGDMTIACNIPGYNPDIMAQCIVDPKTVSQYIWKDDSKKKHIFEGDILKHVSGRLYLVEYAELIGMYVLHCISDATKGADFILHSGDEFEIVGNRYDNPEMVGDV